MKTAVIAALFLTAGSAHAATFVAEAKDDTVTVFSTSKVKEHCQVKNTFSYTYKDERFTTTQSCSIDVVPGAHLMACTVKDATIGKPKIEKPVEVVSCTPAPQ